MARARKWFEITQKRKAKEQELQKSQQLRLTGKNFCHREMGGFFSHKFVVNFLVVMVPIGSMGLVYLPTFTIKNQQNVGEYTIHGWRGKYGHVLRDRYFLFV